MIDELGINCVILAQIMPLVSDSAKMRTNQRSSLFIHILTIHSSQTTYRFNGSYDGTRSLSGKLLDHMAKEVD